MFHPARRGDGKALDEIRGVFRRRLSATTVLAVVPAGQDDAATDTASHGMMVGMTSKAKIAVSLPPELVERAHQAVAQGRASSVSAYVADAIAQKSKLDDLASLLDEMLAATGGPLTAEESVEADRVLGR